MRTIILSLGIALLQAGAARATPALTAQQAAADVLKDGYTRVALTERAPDAWDVWASKDGMSYEVKIDPKTGSVIQQVPIDGDD